jgi:hypothetical protein
MVNRTQMLVLGFFLLAVTSLLVILAAAPEVYDQALRLPTGNHALEITFLAALVGFIGLYAIKTWGVTSQPCGSVSFSPSAQCSVEVVHDHGPVHHTALQRLPGRNRVASSRWCKSRRA